MKVTLAQHGGQAASIYLRRAPLVVDAAALDTTKAAELRGLVDAAKAAPVAAATSAKARDQMSYKITIEDAGGETVLSGSDTAMSAEFGKLLSWLRRNPGQ